MATSYLRKYGVQTIINFELYEVDGVDLRVDAADGGTDCNIRKDQGADATCTNDFVDEGLGYSLTLTATEMQAAEVTLYIVDSATKVYLDAVLKIETYGNASAEHSLDLDDADGSTLTETGGDGAQLTEAGGDGDHLVEVQVADGSMVAASYAADAFAAATFATGAFTADAFAADAIVAATLATGAISADAFAADAIVAATLATGALTADAFAANALVAATFNADCITSAKIADDAISAEHLNTGALTADAFAADALVAATFATDSIAADALAADALAEINAEVVDALATDTYAEPAATTAPGATVSIEEKISYIYAVLRNKTETTATKHTIYQDDGSTEIMTAVLSDDATTYTKAEYIAGT